MKLHEIKQPEVIVIDRPPVKKPEEIQLNKPGGFNVCILNDDFTPFEVVVESVVSAVGIAPEEAMRRVNSAHQNGYCVVATYANGDVAETVADNIMRHAQANKNYDHYRADPHFRRLGGGPWPLTAEVMEAGG